MRYTLLIALVGLCVVGQGLQLEYHFAVNNSVCAPPGFINPSSGACQCLNGSVLNSSSGLCECPASLPWLNAGACSPCSFPDVFENTTNTCYICPNGYFYNLTLGYCVQIVCPSGLVYNPSLNLCQCPSALPHLYAQACHQCPLNQYFAGGSCLPCWNGSYYDSAIAKCVCNESLGFFPKGVNLTGCLACYYPDYFNHK
jgi:hypothetical protein